MALDRKTGKLADIASLDHVNISTNDVNACRRFYVHGLGFEEGFRPALAVRGLWLYIGSSPVIHIVQVDEALPKNSGTIDHIAFRAHDFEKFTARLDTHGIKWDDREIPGIDLHQLVCFDPHGIKVEINFEGRDRPWKTLEKVRREMRKSRVNAKGKAKTKTRKKVKEVA